MGQLAGKADEPAIRRVFEELGRAGRDVYLVRGIGLINVHVRSESPGWWNILKTVKEDMDFLEKRLGVNCYYVLLIGRNDRFVANGYVVSDFHAPPLVKHPGTEATKYTINERQHLDASKMLLSVENVANALLGYAKE